MSWHTYLPRTDLEDLGKTKHDPDLNDTEAKQFTRAKRAAVAIAKSGEAGDPKGTFDISLSGHSPSHGEKTNSRPEGITVSVAQDQAT